MHHSDSPVALSRLLALVAALLLLTACASSTNPTSTPTPPDDPFSDLPAEARVARGAGQPRPAGYWALWNSCAPENRADVAAANGGREAGWILVDDLLADPGIQLGNYPVPACPQALALLQGRTAAGEESGDPVYGLAAALLAAELNMRAGSEICPIADEAALGGHLVLASVDFDGRGEYGAALSDETANAIPRLVELLEGYNRGDLCL
jgi:hypothetical protein